MNPDKRSVTVSVVIATYNAQEYLNTAVDSVLRQTSGNFELIIVDDCSGDSTWEIAKSYEAADNRVQAVRMPANAGQYAAMNHAIGLARGEWIAILDSDDWYQPERLKTLIDSAEASGVNIAADNLCLYDNSAQVSYCLFSPLPTAPQFIDRHRFMKRSNPLVHNRSDFGILKPVFRASTLRKHCISYLEVRNGGDYYFLLSWLLRGERILLLPEPFYVYVEPVGIMSHKLSHSARKPYAFLNFKFTNDLFLRDYKFWLTRREKVALQLRGKAFVELDRSERLRSSLSGRRCLEAWSIYCEAPFVLPLTLLMRCVHLLRRLRIRTRMKKKLRNGTKWSPAERNRVYLASL